jgi:serine phosphatase RsbU (regulator of sigma subunit)
MSAELLTKLPSSDRLARLESRAGRVLLLLVGIVGYVAAATYHVVVFLNGTPPPLGLEVGYNAVVLASFAALWLLLSYVFRRRQPSPARTFWTTLLLGVLFVGVGWGLAFIGRPADLTVASAGFDYETGVPLTLATVVKMNLLGPLEVTFAFIILLRFRDLVLFKRTRTSERNWHLMLVLMSLAALFMFMKAPQAEWHWFDGLVMVPAVVFMVINSFRLSWIVYLPFREKMTTIGLTLLLLTMLVVGMSVGGDSLLPGASTYLSYYSQPLNLFKTLALVFGILYCTTAFLSLLFHLPTTGDFQRKADEMAAMHSLTHLVSQVFDSERLLSTIAASPVDAGTASATWLAVSDVQSGSLRPRIVATHNIDPARVRELVDTAALYQELAASGEPLLLEQASADHRVTARPGEGVGSLLGLPLVARDEMLGALFATREVAHGFEKDDVEAMTVFAAQAALALDNARLFEERVEKERLARELSIAREVQRKLLPQHLPALDGLSIAASSVSAQEVGGDYYDLCRLSDRRLSFIVADVSGKGTSAAFYMAEMQGIYKAVSPIAPAPRDFLIHANRALTGSLEKNVFISVLYGVLDLETEVLTLARAGHCPAATINLNGEARFLRTQGLGLGLDSGEVFERTLMAEEIRLEPGDVFVLYTDGVVESRSPAGEEYGYDRLLDTLRAHRHEDADELHASLLADLNAFIGQPQYSDDMTLLVLKWHGIDLAVAPETPEAAAQHHPPPSAVVDESPETSVP